ncbi:MAG: hypothetical protein ACTSWA_12775 [Candidatus Thorarchaeota archaeon]
MGRKVQEFRPNVVLASAIYSGLSALVNLAYNRKSSQTATQFNQIREIWEKTRKAKSLNRQIGSHDFSSVQDVESALRTLYLQILWTTTRCYGNRETKRVYSWREGTVGPLNGLLNFTGSALRNTVVPRYPFPDPDMYEVRKYPNGQKKVFPKSVANKIPAEDNVKVYDRAGYRGNSKHPRVLLSHPTLPALDFGDMIRAHLVELCRQCFIYNVPRNEAQRYIRLLIHRLIPFLDWVYTQGKTGRKNFYPGADEELQKIVRKIQTHFGIQSGRKERISQKIERPPSDIDVKFLIEKIELILAASPEEDVREKCATILKHIEDGIVTDIEVSKFVEDITKKTSREGTDWHRVLLSGFAHPRSLKEAVFAGDSLLETSSGLQYLAEVPVKGTSGAGSIDLVLFARIKKHSEQYIWTPVMILEIKTKAGFNFNLYGKRPRTKKLDVFVPVLSAWKRSLTEHEWNSMKESISPKPHLTQLDAYESALLSEYNALFGGVIKLNQLWKGVVTLDITQDFSRTKRAFDQLLEQLTGRLVDGEFSGQWKALTIEKNSFNEPPPRVAITMTPNTGDISLLKSIEPPNSINMEDPFIERMEDDIFFTQYVSIPSPSASGKTAAWLAKNWHLLNHLAELDETSISNLFLVDLLGDYPSERLTEMRFGLDVVKQKKQITKFEYKRLRKLLGKIRFINLQDAIDRFLFDNDSEGILEIRDTILQDTDSGSKNKIVLVDGWSDLEKMLPATNRKNLSILENTLLQTLKETSQEVIWVGDGVYHPLMNKTYQRSCVRPLYYSSPRNRIIDEILWNLPTAPRKLGWLSPQYDDSRVIIQDIPTTHPPWISAIHVPMLKGLTKKFRGATIKDPVKATEYLGSLNQKQRMYGRLIRGTAIQVRSDAINEDSLDSVKRQAVTLIPSLRRKQEETTPEETSDDWTITYTPMDSEMTHPSLMSRLRLDVLQPLPIPNRVSKEIREDEEKEIYIEANGITRGWIHKTPAEDDEPVVTSRRPPHAYSRKQPNIDTLETRRREVQRIATAAEFLARTKPHYNSLFQEIASICDYDRDVVVDEDYLLSILQQVRATIHRKNEPRQLWELLLDTRLHSADLLNTDNQQVLRQAQQYNPEILELYGMNLFLSIASVTDRVLKKVEPSICKSLWSAVARWQFYQMGFEPENNKFSEQRYDFQTIHANLVWRAQQMKEITPATTSTFPVQFGQLLVRDGVDDGQSWLLFPSFKSNMFGVFLEKQMSPFLRQGWYRGVIDPEWVKEEAEDALSRDGWDEYSIALVDVNTQRVLFIKTQGDDGYEWTLTGAFEYGNPPKEQSQPVRWIRLSQPRPETLLAMHGFTLDTPPADIRTLCDSVLKEACEWDSVIRDVTCVLTLDAEKKVFRIELHEGYNTIAQKETTSTDDVISFLRYPLRKGEYFSTADGTYLRWNPLQDIEYESVTTQGADGTTDHFSLTIFKPLIHRSSFFPESYSIPTSCEELLQTKQGEDVTLRIIVDELIQSIGSKKYLKVQFDEVTTSRLVKFEQEEMGIFDVALLTECEQLMDVDSGTRYNVSLKAEALVPLKIVHLLSEYPILESTILSIIDDLQLAEAEEYEEGLEAEEYLEPEHEEGVEEEQEHGEADYAEGVEEEPEYLEPEYDGD